MNDLRGIDLGNGVLLAPHPFVSNEDEEINYKPVTPENYALKIRAIREFCRELEERWPHEAVMAVWASGHIMCILKYGEGYEQDERSEMLNAAFPTRRAEAPPGEARRWWRWW